MSLEISGKLVKILDAQNGVSKSGKEWVKQAFVIDTGAKYNPEVSFNLFGADKVALLDNLHTGENLTVAFNLSSREYKGNYYTSADAWKIQKVDLTEDTDEGNINADLPF